MKLIRKTVGIHQSARQFGFPSSAGYMLIIVLVGLFPIHIWNLQHSRELIKLEEKYIKKKINHILNSTFYFFLIFFPISSQPGPDKLPPAEQPHKAAFLSIKGQSSNDTSGPDTLGRQSKPSMFINSCCSQHPPLPTPTIPFSTWPMLVIKKEILPSHVLFPSPGRRSMPRQEQGFACAGSRCGNGRCVP